jgi:hypothetical protein
MGMAMHQLTFQLVATCCSDIEENHLQCMVELENQSIMYNKLKL